MRNNASKIGTGFFRTVILTLAICTAFYGCAAVGIDPTPEAVVEEGAALPTQVAVLPFVNKTADPDAGAVVRKMFYNFFSSLNYRDIEPGLVDEDLRKRGFYDKLLAGENVDARQLGQFLGVDAVIFGEVTDFGKTYAVIYSEIEAGLKARMVSCVTGKTIWELEHTATIGQGDVPLSLTGLAATVVRSALNYNQAKKVNAASKLSMQMIETIPNPERITDPPPRIELMVHNASEKLLRPGQSLRVVLIGEPGNQASWEVVPLVKRQPLTEKEPGTYIGSYRVKPDDKLVYGRLSGYLKSSKGLESQWSDVLGSVSMGEPTTLPAVVSKDLALKAEKSPYFVGEALLVMPNATLTVEPGSVIWFHKGGMAIKGRILARGAQDAPIRISGLGASEWKGILMDQGTGQSVFSYCEISKAEFGLRTVGTNFTLDHCLFQDNGWGVVLDGGQADIKNCLFRTSEKAGVSARNAKLVITHSVVSQNQKGGILLKTTDGLIQNNNIYNNGEYDFKVLDAEKKVSAINNWWGKQFEDVPRIIGEVEYEPVLSDPIDYTIFGKYSVNPY
jgi:hypothetical protein